MQTRVCEPTLTICFSPFLGYARSSVWRISDVLVFICQWPGGRGQGWLHARTLTLKLLGNRFGVDVFVYIIIHLVVVLRLIVCTTVYIDRQYRLLVFKYIYICVCMCECVYSFDLFTLLPWSYIYCINCTDFGLYAILYTLRLTRRIILRESRIYR